MIPLDQEAFKRLKEADKHYKGTNEHTEDNWGEVENVIKTIEPKTDEEKAELEQTLVNMIINVR